MRGLSGRRVLLTGGASGIGRATAIRLAEEGCRVGILDIDEAGAAATAELCGGKAWTAATDISRPRRGGRPPPRFERTSVQSISWPTSPAGT